MNAEYDELETLLGTELHDRADVIPGSALTLTDVRGRATSIRRRRRGLTGVAVAAILAVAAPIGINAMQGADTPEKADLAPSPPKVVRTTLTLDGLARGIAPRVEYFTPDGVVLPGSGLQPLEGRWRALVPSRRDGWWLGLSPDKDAVIVLSQSFEQLSETPINQNLVSNVDGGLVAWTTLGADAQTLTLHSTVEPVPDVEWELPAAPPVDPIDLMGDGSLLYAATSRQDGSVKIGIAGEDGTTSMFEGTWVDAISASPETGLVAVQTKSNPDTSGCFGVIDPSSSTSQAVWETCDYSLGAFSPDGRYLLASDPYEDGIGRTSLSVLDAVTGDLVAAFKQPRGSQVTLPMMIWETSDTIVSTAFEGTSWMVLRLGLDGTLERASDTVEADPFADFPITFGADRLRG